MAALLTMLGPAGAMATGVPIAQACAQLAVTVAALPAASRAAPEPAVTTRPARAQAFVDPQHGTCLARVTSRDSNPVRGFVRNDYSRRQAFNADATRFLLSAQDGGWHLYDAASLSHLKRLPELAGDAEPQWHPTQAQRLYFLPNNGVGMAIYELDVDSGRSTVASDLAQRLKRLWPGAMSAWTRSEGSPSRDGRYWALQVEDRDWKGLGLVTFDLVEDRLIASYDFRAHGRGRPDHVSMSPSGRHVVVSWDDEVVAFDREFRQSIRLQRKSEHSDIAVAVNGDDVYVGIDYEARGGPVFMVNLRTGERTDLFASYVAGTATAMHFSGKAYDRPGWVLMSTYADYGRGGEQWLHRRLLAVELRANGRVLGLAHHRSVFAKYWTEPQASVNRDFTRVLFNSNWGVRSETDVDAYLLVLPAPALPAARP